MVSAAALEAGGYVHGIIPESLVERASQTGNGLKSGEGQGVDILDNDYDGRFTTEMTLGMHEVSPLVPSGERDLKEKERSNCTDSVEEIENG
jgi:hypothetical protein